MPGRRRHPRIISQPSLGRWPNQKVLRLLQTLYAWSKQKSPRSLAFASMITLVKLVTAFHNVTHTNQPREFVTPPERYVHTILKQMNNLRSHSPKMSSHRPQRMLKVYLRRTLPLRISSQSGSHIPSTTNLARKPSVSFQQDCLKAYNEHEKMPRW